MDNELQQLDAAFEDLPKEAKDFLYEGPFAQVLDALVQKFQLSAEQKSILDYHLTRIVLLIEHPSDLIPVCESWGFDQEKQRQLIDEVDRTLIAPLVEATNYVVEDEEGEGSQLNTVNAPSPADVLASLKARLTNPTAIAPVSRELPSGPTVQPKPSPAPTQQKRTGIDPYREIPTQ